MPGHYTKSLKKKLLKKPDSLKPDSIKPKMMVVSKSFKKDMKKGKEAGVIAKRLKRMKKGSLSTAPSDSTKKKY